MANRRQLARLQAEMDDETGRIRKAAADHTANHDSHPIQSALSGLTQRQATLLHMQHTIGNAAVARQVTQRRSSTGSRSEGENEDGAVPVPDYRAPIESDSADTRKPSGPPAPPVSAQPEDDSSSTRSEGVGAVQRDILGIGAALGSAYDTVNNTVGDLMGWFPTYSQIIADSTVKAAADNAWQETLNATTPTARREQGFWIRFNKTAKSYSVTATTVAPTVGNTTGASVNLPPKPADTTTDFTIASFHTHTPTTYRAVGRPVGPSGADNSADAADNVVGVVYDYVSPDGSGDIPAGHPLNSAATLYHSGPNRRS